MRPSPDGREPTSSLPSGRSFDREILRLAVPALGALAAEPLYVLADTAVVGHLGTSSLGGLAVASSVLLVGYSLFIFLAYGTTSSVARLLGAGRHPDAAFEAVQGMWLAVVVGLAVLVMGLLLGEPLLRALGAEGAVLEEGTIYLRVSLFGMPAMLLVLAGTGYLRGLQDTRTPLMVAALSVSANLAIEVVLIYGYGYGIGASALATVLAQLGSAVAYVVRVRDDVRTHDVGLRPDPAAIRRLLVVGRDLFLRTAALRAALVLTTAVAARKGESQLAGHQIAFEVWSFLALSLDAIAIAAQAMIGRRLGAGAAAEARVAGNRMIEWGVVAGLLFGVGLLALRSPLPHIFTADAAVVTWTQTVLLCVAALQPVAGVVFVLDGILIGAGDMRFLAWAMVGAFTCFTPAALAVLLLDVTVTWLWAAITVLMVTRMLALGWRYRSDRWVVTGAPT